MHVTGVHVDPTSSAHVLLLEEQAEAKRKLPIWIGPAEARSIALQLEEVPMPRPNTHDLIKNVLAGLEVSIQRVTVTELRGGTYFAEIALEGIVGRVAIDSRPSDAIAIAVRTGTPIFATDLVLRQAGRERGEEAFDIDWKPPADRGGSPPEQLGGLPRIAQNPGASAQ
jgi:bifunctional DNase/RNase